MDDHLSGTSVTRYLLQPTRTYEPYANARFAWRGGQPLRSYSALHRMGFTVPAPSPGTAVGSYPTVSPLPATSVNSSAGGLLSAALSVGLPRLGVTQHPALWCSDFPHPECAHSASGTLTERDHPARLIPTYRSDRYFLLPYCDTSTVFTAHNPIDPPRLDEELWRQLPVAASAGSLLDLDHGDSTLHHPADAVVR